MGVDADSDHPPEVVTRLPRPGRDLDLDLDAVAALKPDLVLGSLTVPGHERLVEGLRARGLSVLVQAPTSLAEVFADIRRIASALGHRERGEQLVAELDAGMPVVRRSWRPRVLVEWWPKPVIAAARHSWVHELIERAGGDNALADQDRATATLTPEQAGEVAPDLVAISWCGVPLSHYRPRQVLQRPGWAAVPAVQRGAVVPITEAFLGRPGPRLLAGYRALCAALDPLAPALSPSPPSV